MSFVTDNQVTEILRTQSAMEPSTDEGQKDSLGTEKVKFRALRQFLTVSNTRALKNYSSGITNRFKSAPTFQGLTFSNI